MGHRVIIVGALVVTVLTACRPTHQHECVSNAQCEAGQVCLPKGVCAAACESDQGCGGDQFCSAAKACIAQGSCAIDADCASHGGDSVCWPDGSCHPPCVKGSCGEGMACLDRRCTPSPIPDVQERACGGRLFYTTYSKINVQIVLDASATMGEVMSDGRTKLEAANQLVAQLTSQFGPRVHFGLDVVKAQPQCAAGPIELPLGSSPAQIRATLPRQATLGINTLTPALQAAWPEAYARLANEEPALILLITDGKTTCDSSVSGTLQKLALAGVGTFVVGFDELVDSDQLNAMALSGGLPRTGDNAYYRAPDGKDLQALLGKLVGDCAFPLGETPPNPNKMALYLGAEAQPRDPTRTNGWDYDVVTGRMALYGESCETAMSTPGTEVTIIFSCPDAPPGN